MKQEVLRYKEEVANKELMIKELISSVSPLKAS